MPCLNISSKRWFSYLSPTSPLSSWACIYLAKRLILDSNDWFFVKRAEHKLFIGMLPKNVSEDEVSSLFSQYGTIKDLQILRGSQQTSKGSFWFVSAWC